LTFPDALTVGLMSLGGFFFLAGTVGLIRFPDARTRLHALTKADNLGLGLVAAGLALQVGSVPGALKLAGIWVLSLLAGATSAHLIGETTLDDEQEDTSPRPDPPRDLPRA